MTDTIFALSSGSPPAAIGVIRISGPAAGEALVALAGSLPKSRRATFRLLHDPESGDELDRALVLWLPGPATATGEDSAELHCHGGRAVIAAVCAALSRIDGLRAAEPGEFTRRAFANGKIDLAEAEGLADLLTAETELQRRTAQVMAGGALSRTVDHWREGVLGLSARIEAVLDFSDEGEVGEAMPPDFASHCSGLAEELRAWLVRPRAEPLREGFRVVLAGPPNAGKSTLFNALVQREAAITAAEAGTTRDVLTASVAFDGIALTFVDTAGLRDDHASPIERIGIERARGAAAEADLVLWLGAEGEGPGDGAVMEIAAQSDTDHAPSKSRAAISVSAVSGSGLGELRERIIAEARARLPRAGEGALNQRQHRWLSAAHVALVEAAVADDPLIAAEGLRAARAAFDALVGRTGTEAMLDTIFGRFCIGK